MDSSIHALAMNQGLISESSDIIRYLYDFYSHLYSNNDTKSDQEIKAFLEKLSLPKIKQDTSAMTQPITSKEVEMAIKKLHPGKAPGLDGLTADFYNHFQEVICDILADVFNAIFEDKTLSWSQRVAIIILLFQKGDCCLVGNYHPISLTNTDYKILAYILTACLSDHLSDVIHANQTVYMPKQFIGTNIQSVQDFVDYCVHEKKEHLVLFLDFKKAFDSISHKCVYASCVATYWLACRICFMGGYNVFISLVHGLS